MVELNDMCCLAFPNAAHWLNEISEVRAILKRNKLYLRRIYGKSILRLMIKARNYQKKKHEGSKKIKSKGLSGFCMAPCLSSMSPGDHYEP